MAYENFVRDLSYLRDGTLSDLTLHFREKSWQIHRAFACSHSQWFRKALTIGLAETQSGVVTLQDEAVYEDAIDCMVSYFYEASYKASTYSMSEALLHAQVAIIADKYDCASLFKLAKSSFAKTLQMITMDDWATTAAFVYETTTTEVPAHVQVRYLVAHAVASRRAVLRSALRSEHVAKLLQAQSELAADLLRVGHDGPDSSVQSDSFFTCGHCNYGHVGSSTCKNVTTVSNGASVTVCSQCKKTNKTSSQRWASFNEMRQAVLCPGCNGIHSPLPT